MNPPERLEGESDESFRTRLAIIAQDKDEGLAKIATAVLAWVHWNDTDRAERIARDRRLTWLGALILVGVFLLVFANVQAYYQRQDFARVQVRAEAAAADAKVAASEARVLGQQIKDCIGEDPNTECRKIQARNTTPVVGLLQKAADCQALRAEGKFPEPCADVNKRTEQLAAGIDPFPTVPMPSTTTTVPASP